MDRDSFRKRLLDVAQEEARHHRYHFSAEAHSQINRLIYEGVGRMNDQELDNQIQRNEAERNLKRLVIQMVNNARSRSLYESIDARAFSSVHLSICPLWPFC